jgi:hypothetical protein
MRSEQNLLLSLTLIVTFTFFLNLENKATESYNQSVKTEQIDKLYFANNSDKTNVSFGFTCNHTPFWYLLYALQFFTNPLSYFLLKARTLGRFLLSKIFTAITFYCFSIWIYETFYYGKFADYSDGKVLSFNEFFLIGSTKLEFALFLFVLILFVVQIFILLRFVIENFQARIPLR